MSERFAIIIGLTVFGVGGTILIFFLFRACIRKAALSEHRFVSVIHLILLALPLVLFILQDLKILPIAWPNFLFWMIGGACTLLSLGLNIRLWGWGYGLAFTLCEIVSSLVLTMLILSAAYGIVIVAVLVFTVFVSFMGVGSSQSIRVSGSPLGTDPFYVTPASHGGFEDNEGNYYTSISGKRLLGSDGSTYYIID